MSKQLPTNRKLQVPITGTLLLRMKFTDQTNNWPISTGRNGLPQPTYKAVAHLKWQQNNLQQTTIHHTPSLNTERRTPPYHTLMLPTSLPRTANLHTKIIFEWNPPAKWLIGQFPPAKVDYHNQPLLNYSSHSPLLHTVVATLIISNKHMCWCSTVKATKQTKNHTLPNTIS